MTSVLFVGGPEHGRRREIDGTLPSAIAISVPTSTSLDLLSVLEPTSAVPYETTYYALRRYVTGVFRLERSEPVYVNADGRRWGQGDNPRADHLFADLYPAGVPRCVVPGCDALAPRLFVADEYGRLAGRDWKPGDEIRLCVDHGADVWRAQYIYEIDQLAEWLRPDARLDAIDAYDAAHDLLYGDQISALRGRGLRVEKVK
jgi:hypothetical protein